MENGCDLRKQASLLFLFAKRASCLRSEKGSALVEMAITLPLMLLVLTAAASYSYSFYNMQELGNAVSGAAQALGVEASVVANPCATVVTQVTASLPQWNASSLAYTVTFSDSAGTAYTAYSWTGSTAPSGCSAGSSGSTPQASGEPIVVTVKYSASELAIFQWLPSWFISPMTSLKSTETAIAN